MSNLIQNQYTPDYISPPGETLLETIEEMGITKTELAERLGISPQIINNIIEGKTAISPEISLLLQQVLGISASFWDHREQYYREALAKIELASLTLPTHRMRGIL